MELEEKIIIQSVNLKVLSKMFMEFAEKINNNEKSIINYKIYIDKFITNLIDKNELESMILLKEIYIGTIQLYLNSPNDNPETLIEQYSYKEPETKENTKLKRKYLVELKQSINNTSNDENISTIDRIKQINRNLNSNIYTKEEPKTIENVVEITENFLLILDELTQKLENIVESKQIFRKNLTKS